MGDLLAIYFTQDEVQAAQSSNHVTHAIATYHFQQDLHVHQGRALQLDAPGMLVAVASEVNALSPFAPFDSKVRFAAWRGQSYRGASADGTSG